MTESFYLQLNRHVEKEPQKIAICAPGFPALRYDELRNCIENIKEQLARNGINQGDSVAFVSDASPGSAILGLTLTLYNVAIPLNPDFRSSELENYLRRVQVNTVLTPSVTRNSIVSIADKLDIDTFEYNFEDQHFTLHPLGKKKGKTSHSTIDNGIPQNGVILQTSGSTALPRIVPLPLSSLQFAAQNVIRSLALSETDRCLHMLPLYHIGGIVDVLMAPLMSGGSVIFNRGFDIDNFFRILGEYNPTWTQTVPVMLQALVEKAQWEELAINTRLRFIRSVSSPLPLSLYESASNTFSTSIIEIYGMSEAAGVITSNPLDKKQHKAGSVGITAGPEIRVVRETGDIANAGVNGEVQIKGNSVMQGYLGEDLQLDNESFTDDGWLQTGDTGYLDEQGFLFLTGRLKDMINRGGEKISPREIDECILQHPGVIDAACFSVPHTTLGEEIATAIVIKSGNLSTKELQDFLKDRLAYFKIPSQIFIVDDIPRTNGKLQRHQLATLLTNKIDSTEVKATGEAELSGLSKKLVEIWSDILKLDNISMDDDFFYMGGNSLLATVMVNRFQEECGVPVIVSAIYDAPVLSEFEQHLIQNYPELVRKLSGNSEG